MMPSRRVGNKDLMLISPVLAFALRSSGRTRQPGCSELLTGLRTPPERCSGLNGFLRGSYKLPGTLYAIPCCLFIFLQAFHVVRHLAFQDLGSVGRFRLVYCHAAAS